MAFSTIFREIVFKESRERRARGAPTAFVAVHDSASCLFRFMEHGGYAWFHGMAHTTATVFVRQCGPAEL